MYVYQSGKFHIGLQIFINLCVFELFHWIFAYKIQKLMA